MVSTVSRCDRKRARPVTAKVTRYVNVSAQLSPAGRSGSDPGRSIHQSVADGPEARTAVGASVPAAVAGPHLAAALPPLVQQEFLGVAQAPVVPRRPFHPPDFPVGLPADLRP